VKKGDRGGFCGLEGSSGPQIPPGPPLSKGGIDPATDGQEQKASLI
jgi:hypothetical protein